MAGPIFDEPFHLRIGSFSAWRLSEVVEKQDISSGECAQDVPGMPLFLSIAGIGVHCDSRKPRVCDRSYFSSSVMGSTERQKKTTGFSESG